jgi:hypothetical protein
MPKKIYSPGVRRTITLFVVVRIRMEESPERTGIRSMVWELVLVDN